MCLITSTNIPKIASEDITAYKLLFKYKGIHFTPFRSVEINISEIQEPEERVDYTNTSSNEDDVYYIDKGYVHSYKYINAATSAMILQRLFSRQDFDYIELYECTISAGSEYYEDDNSYASDKLKYVKLIDQCMN